MKPPILSIPFVLILVSVLSACNLSDEVTTLSDGWLYVSEGKQDKVIDGGLRHIPCNVTGYNYDDDFIIASQKPTIDCFLGRDTLEYQQGKSATYYWLIVHKTKKLLGPLNKEEYQQVRKQNKVPEELEIQPAY